VQAYRIETTVQQDGTVTLKDLPFQAGDSIEVIILTRSGSTLQKDKYPLRGTPITYSDPTEPVAVEDWEATR
jgi:hypothetical protein